MFPIELVFTEIELLLASNKEEVIVFTIYSIYIKFQKPRREFYKKNPTMCFAFTAHQEVTLNTDQKYIKLKYINKINEISTNKHETAHTIEKYLYAVFALSIYIYIQFALPIYIGRVMTVMLLHYALLIILYDLSTLGITGL